MGFRHTDMAAANEECRQRGHQIIDVCDKCQMKVVLHCSDCKQQTTGCLCTELERFGEDEAWKRAIDNFGEELARERFRRAGFWIPGTPRIES